VTHDLQGCRPAPALCLENIFTCDLQLFSTDELFPEIRIYVQILYKTCQSTTIENFTPKAMLQYQEQADMDYGMFTERFSE